ncbi:MAG: glycosyltransferase [Candidatus Hodarchaeales archaeon]|jgi:glycosyltransferase involved in cell wall biosynthesis
MEPIRILQIIDSLNIGGTEKQCVEMVRRINSGRFTMHLATLDKDGPLYHVLIKTGIPFTEFKISGGFYRPRSIFQILKLASFIRREKFYIVQTHGFYSTVPGVIAAKIARVPVVIAGKRDMCDFLPRIKIMTEKILWRFCDKIVVNANRIKDYLISEEKIPGEKITVIYNGVDLGKYVDESEIGYTSKTNIVGMVANFRQQKDHRTFLDGAARVLKQRMDVRFSLVGSGPLEDEMKRYARDIGIKNGVVFHGRRTGKELYDILRSFTISVLSSTNEGMPNVILESMAFGIPVIANPSGGVPELVDDGITGYFFPYKRPDILAEKIIYLLENKNIAIEMGKKGREKIQNDFKSESMRKRFEDLYSSLFYKKIEQFKNMQHRSEKIL